MEKIKVTSQQLGQHLFRFAAECLTADTENTNFIKEMGIDPLDFPTNREILIAHLFAITNGLKGTSKDNETGKDVLDQMHLIYCNEIGKLKALSRESNDKVIDEAVHLKKRYEEYWAAIKEKKEPGPMYWLAKKVTENIGGKNSEDILAISSMVINLAGTAHGTRTLVDQYEVVE